MTERIDHAAEATRIHAKVREAAQGVTTEEMLASAQVHATLALVEQQRIANTLKIDEMAMRGNYLPPEFVKDIVGI